MVRARRIEEFGDCEISAFGVARTNLSFFFFSVGMSS